MSLSGANRRNFASGAAIDIGGYGSLQLGANRPEIVAIESVDADYISVVRCTRPYVQIPAGVVATVGLSIANFPTMVPGITLATDDAEVCVRIRPDAMPIKIRERFAEWLIQSART